MEENKKENAKKWIKERMSYIGENCDLNKDENKIAFDSLKIALQSLDKIEELEKMVDLMVEYIKDSGIYAEHCQIRIESDECDENNYNCEDCIKEYFKKKAKL